MFLAAYGREVVETTSLSSRRELPLSPGAWAGRRLGRWVADAIMSSRAVQGEGRALERSGVEIRKYLIPQVSLGAITRWAKLSGVCLPGDATRCVDTGNETRSTVVGQSIEGVSRQVRENDGLEAQAGVVISGEGNLCVVEVCCDSVFFF